MQNADCCRCEQAVYQESEMDSALRRHAAACPRCRALCAAAALSAPRLDAPSDDALTRQLCALAAAAAARHADHRERGRWLAPALIGAGTYLFTACVWLALLVQGPAAPGPAAPPVPAAGLALPSLPAPGPAAIGSVVVASLLWITVTVTVARRRAAVSG
jgi:hypothetical protein